MISITLWAGCLSEGLGQMLHAGELKLGDFGLARIFGSPDRKWTNQVGVLLHPTTSCDWLPLNIEQRSNLLRALQHASLPIMITPSSIDGQ